MKALHDQVKDKVNHESYTSGGLKIVGDLERFEYPAFNYAMTLYDQYDRNGILPFEGVHSDQPAQVLEVFDLLQSLKLEQEEKARREANRGK